MKIRLRISHLLLLGSAILIAPTIGMADDIDVNVRSPQATNAPPGTRFEILQSTLAAKLTLRLDKYSGRVWQLVRTASDDYDWEELQVLERPTIQSPNRARFQLFTSSLAVRYTFLLDADTGKTWSLVSGKRKGKDGTDYEVISWEPF